MSSVNIIIPSCVIFPSGTKLSEDSRKYGVENTCTSGSTLSKAASNFARTRAQMEKERGNLLKALGTQVIILLPENLITVLVSLHNNIVDTCIFCELCLYDVISNLIYQLNIHLIQLCLCFS